MGDLNIARLPILLRLHFVRPFVLERLLKVTGHFLQVQDGLCPISAVIVRVLLKPPDDPMDHLVRRPETLIASLLFLLPLLRRKLTGLGLLCLSDRSAIHRQDAGTYKGADDEDDVSHLSTPQGSTPASGRNRPWPLSEAWRRKVPNATYGIRQDRRGHPAGAANPV